MRPPSAVFSAILVVAGFHFGVADISNEQLYPVPPPGEDVLSRSLKLALKALDPGCPSSTVHANVEDAGGLASSSSELSMVNLKVPWYIPPAEGAYDLQMLTLNTSIGPQASLDSEVVANIMMLKEGAELKNGLFAKRSHHADRSTFTY